MWLHLIIEFSQIIISVDVSFLKLLSALVSILCLVFVFALHKVTKIDINLLRTIIKLKV